MRRKRSTTVCSKNLHETATYLTLKEEPRDEDGAAVAIDNP
jgi:hypothetical protein